nr:hypothetical protein [Tanacetum cinerariifolium]
PFPLGQHHFNVESDLIGSPLNHDSSIIPSSLKLILFSMSSPRLLYDNSSPHPPKEFIFENSNADIESFPPSPIMEEIDLTFTPDDPMPPSIEEDDDDSRDTLIREEFLNNYSLPIPENKSFHFDIPSFSRPPAKPPDGNTGILNVKMMGDVSDQKVPIPELTITLVSNQEKSPDLLSHRLYDNSSPRPPKEFIFKNSDTTFESFSLFPIPIEDSDSFMKEIDLSFTPGDPMPPGIEEDDYDSERDILILEELLSNDSLSLLENESFHFD